MRGSCQQLFRIASFAFCLILAACNGGGGGDSNNGSSRLSLSSNVLTFNAPNTSSTPSSQIITATVTGVTSGTLYIKIVSTGPAVASITNIIVTGTTSGQGTINPASAATLGPGIHTSTITVYACTTDPNCTSGQLAGSPQTVNVTYTITGVATSATSLSYSIGVSPVAGDLTRQFTVTGYPNQNWIAASDVPWLSVLPANGNADTTTQVTVSLVQAQLDVMFGGTYTGTVTIAPSSRLAVTIPVTLTIARGPYLKPGFPVQTFVTDGTYGAGPESVFITVGNLDSDPELEILVSAYSSGPLWAFNHDGSWLNGWPEEYGLAVGYPSLGNFFSDARQLEVAAGYFASSYASCNADRFVFSGNGQPLPGWPQISCNAGHLGPPQIADVNGDGLDEIFFTWDTINAYRANGQLLSGWPTPSNHENYIVAFGDVDGDSVDEVIAASHSQITAFEFDGSTVAGFPFPTFPSTDSSKIRAGPILTADMDGDGRCEIIEVRKEQSNPSRTFVRLYGANGNLRWEKETLPGEYVGYSTAPALADLDGDGLPEIIVQVYGAIYVWHGNGTLMQGWPVRLGDRHDIGNSSPVVGDVDGDQLPDIVIVTYSGDPNASNVLVFNRAGQLHPTFPKVLPLSTAMAPAIADIDLDGRNEIIIGSTLWKGYWDMYDTVWAFDLGGPVHGPILWGQVGGGPRHQYRYPPK
ncbi:MAG TPA: FG-GAP-like repeat-containing protein [Anaerolineales bacterium]|nr:FG-GAP-like repeat-containing protein [Anaerolineales bacterium]